MDKNILELKNISYSYHSLHGETKALDRITFGVREGEFIAVVGPSGCGKSTLLSIIAGLLPAEDGTILVNNPDGSLHYPRVGYMLQREHLFEWRSIYKNVILGLEINHMLTPERLEYVDSLLRDYDLEKFKDKRPSELSGGMKQRAALIRTLALEPRPVGGGKSGRPYCGALRQTRHRQEGNTHPLDNSGRFASGRPQRTGV